MLKAVPGFRLYFLNIVIICLFGIAYGLVYNWFFYPHKFIEFLEAGTIGLFIGLLICFFELIVLRKTLSRLSFVKVLVIRTLLYALVIIIVLGLVLSVETAFEEDVSYGQALIMYFQSDLFVRDFWFSIIFVPFILVALQILQLFGARKLLRLIAGVYHQPKEMSRIFMFVDLRDSTSIAERLSNKDYSSLLRDFFFDVTDAVVFYGGEIYQYVGDEMVVVWPAKTKDMRCVSCYFRMQHVLEQKKQYYATRYGIIPEFKAGLHFGSVMVTEVGKYKKDIVYHGDVMNTASRIEGACRDLDEKILVSDTLLHHLVDTGEFEFQKKGEIPLRGKKEPILLYGVRPLK